MLKKKLIAALATGMMFSAMPFAGATHNLDNDDFNDIMTHMTNGGVVLVEVDDPVNPTQFQLDKSDAYKTVTKVDMSANDGTARSIVGVTTTTTDATSVATVGHVTTVATDTLTQAKTYTDTQVTAAKAYTDEQVQGAINTSKAYTDTKINGINRQITGLKEDIKDVGAMSAAMASIPAPQYGHEGNVSWGIAAGVYDGATAVAAGLTYDINDRLRTQAKVATRGGENMFGIGIGGSFNGPGDQKTTKDLKSMLVNLSDRLDGVEAQNKALAAENKSLRDKLSVGTIRTTTENYTNMYGHNFVVKEENGEIVLYNLDGSKMTSTQLAALADDYSYNHDGTTFYVNGFKKNSAGNWQYQDVETGEWIEGSQQNAVGNETVTRETKTIDADDIDFG